MGGKFDIRLMVFYIMVICYVLRKIDGEMFGEFFELKMFEFIKWFFEEGDLGGGRGDDEE